MVASENKPAAEALCKAVNDVASAAGHPAFRCDQSGFSGSIDPGTFSPTAGGARQTQIGPDDWEALWSALEKVSTNQIVVSDVASRLVTFDSLVPTLLGSNYTDSAGKRLINDFRSAGWKTVPPPHAFALARSTPTGVTAVVVYGTESDASTAAVDVVDTFLRASSMIDHVPIPEKLGSVTATRSGRTVQFEIPKAAFARVLGQVDVLNDAASLYPLFLVEGSK